MVDEYVFDIGMHLGEDTAFYLRKGYRVAGFEANPKLTHHCRERFAEAVASGALVIYEGALRAGDVPSATEFFVNPAHSDWGTAVSSWRTRNEVAFNAPSLSTIVPTIHLEQVVAELGVPTFAKIDIEGLDHEILRGFERAGAAPRFVSVESAKANWSDLEEELTLLTAMGYRRFKAVQQRTIPGTTIHTTDFAGGPVAHTFERHSSGPFGDDLDGWLSAAEVRSVYQRIFKSYARWGDTSWLQRTVGRKPIAAIQLIAGRPLPGWFDTHARLD